MGYGGFTNQHMHALTHLFHHFLMVIAFVVKPDSATEIAV